MLDTAVNGWHRNALTTHAHRHSGRFVVSGKALRMSLFKHAESELLQHTTFCPVCKTHVETPLGHADYWNHLIDAHRQWLLSSHGREVITRQPATR